MEGEGEVTREKTRIYVGGLGAGVTEDDLRKTFSALGEVVSVDVVRTKGRSFAYLDFLPSSDKSLPKLFSTYNGCMWKGGKLRLEKAKEHYLLKLRREWQEASGDENKTSDTCNADATESHVALEKPKKPSSEINKQLCLFFPKLGKVKSLGQVGIGKHKYSFQRIQVPPIPTHFCDCEEHSLPFLPTKKNQVLEFEKANDGINEEELNIMNSVMNKIFERANPSNKQVSEKTKPINDESAATENSEEDHLTDEDNLIINVANGSDSMDLLTEMKTMMANQDDMRDDRKKKTMRANRVLINKQKSELVNDDEDNLIINVANESDSMDLLAEMRMMANKDARTKGQEKKAIKKRKSKEKTMVPESSRNCLDTRKARKTEVESDTKPPVSNSLRSLKSTWKDLIGQKVNTPFTISNIIPTVDQDKSNEMKTSESEIHPSDSDHKVECSPEKHAGDMIPAARGGSRRHKSSWTQLVSHGSFSISQIVPDLSLENYQLLNDRVVTESTGKKEMS